jgi:hypothetical protein
MGERTNVKVITEPDGRGVFFYSHDGGPEATPIAVQRALARHVRWDDPSYLARIIFDTLSDGCQGSEYGFGISAEMHNNEWPIIVVGQGRVRMCRIRGCAGIGAVERDWSFEDFCALSIAMLISHWRIVYELDDELDPTLL